jgi:AcrR family transcriptional regulator
VESRPQRGRPPKVNAAAIADAVLEIGMDRATMREVADHLGVGVSTLYHHVSNRQDLVRIAAQVALARLTPPNDSDVHWARWLRSFGRYIREGMGAQPELFEHFLGGRVSDETQLESMGHALEVLHRNGFDPYAAMAAWEAVSMVALGSAADDIRERSNISDGQPWAARVFTALTRDERDDLPNLRALAVAGYQPLADENFERRLTITLVGIAAVNGREIDDDVLGRPGGAQH